VKYKFTPDEAQPVANAVASHLRRQGFKVRYETPLKKDAQYLCPTLLAKKRELWWLVEAQGNPSYGKTIRDLAHWLAANNEYAELYLATTAESDIQTGLLTELEKDGVGFLLVNDDKSVEVYRNAINHALVVTPEPTLKYGCYRQEVTSAVTKFNTVNRKDGLRDMCEIVEGLTEKLVQKAVDKGYFLDERITEGKDWCGQINILASAKTYKSGHRPIVEDTLKTDLHSFRGARNLMAHKPRNAREEAKRQRQFQERMMMGPRLVAELVSLMHRI
jgi:hypothetical protein